MPKLNKLQMRVLMAGALLAILLAIYPPWCEGRFDTCVGYGWLILPPRNYGIKIDIIRLGLEWIIVSIPTAVLLVWLSNSENH